MDNVDFASASHGSGEWTTTEGSSRMVIGTPEPTEADSRAAGIRTPPVYASEPSVHPAEEIYGPINDDPHDSPPHDITLEAIASGVRTDLSREYTQAEKDISWKSASSIIKEDSDGMVKQWIAEIDALPTFAGLFAAALTAFNVEAYKLLQEPQVNPSPEILKRISRQLGSFSVGASSFINSTEPPYEPNSDGSEDPFRPPVFAILLNILWFISLVLSLASGTIGILVKQWLREYLSGLSGDSPTVARRRQYRLNSLVYWHVSFVVAALPVLLHVAFILFLAGLLIFLHALHPIVTAVVSIPVGIILIFICGAAFIPSFRDDCCLYSPQAHAIFWLREQVKGLSLRAFSLILLAMFTSVHFFAAPYSAGRSVKARLRDALRSASSIMDMFVFYPSIWKNGELRCAEEEDSASHLDVDMISTAYSTSSDISVFDVAEQYTVPGLQDELPLVIFAVRAFEITTRQWGDQWPQKTLYRYFGLVNRIVQLSLASHFDPYENQWALHGWDMNTLFPGRLLRVLARREARRKFFAHKGVDIYGESITRRDRVNARDIPCAQPYRLVLASIDRTESALIQDTLRCIAVLTLHPPDDYDPWDDLVWGVGHHLEVVEWPTYRIVAAAASTRFESAMQIAHGYSGGRTQLSSTDAVRLIASIHALRLYLHCLAPIASSRVRNLTPIQLHASRMLSTFQERVLATALWDKLCRDHLRDILPCYNQLVNEIGALPNAAGATRPMVEGLQSGLRCISSKVDSGRGVDSFRDLLTIISIRKTLVQLASRVTGLEDEVPNGRIVTPT